MLCNRYPTIQTEILPSLLTVNQAKFQDASQETNHPEKPLLCLLKVLVVLRSPETHYSPEGEQQSPVCKQVEIPCSYRGLWMPLKTLAAMHPEVCMFACDGEERDQDSRGWVNEGRFEHIYGLRELAEGTYWKIQSERRELKEKSPGVE